MKLTDKEKALIQEVKTLLDSKLKPLTNNEKKRVSMNLYYWYKLQIKREALKEDASV